MCYLCSVEICGGRCESLKGLVFCSPQPTGKVLAWHWRSVPRNEEQDPAPRPAGAGMGL